VHSEFVNIDNDIADDATPLPPPYATMPSNGGPKPREMEEIRRDADVIMGVSPSLAPTKSVTFDPDLKMGG